MIESGITFDYGQLVMDNEFAAMIKHTVNGLEVSDETLAVEIINEIGPFGDFISHDSTFDNMRSQSQPSLIDRQIRENWEMGGGKDLYEKSCEKARHLLETHTPDPLPDSTLLELRNIINAAEKELGVEISKE
jgi:trimethylamine--corrinoid protein Co-methyltransferase